MNFAEPTNQDGYNIEGEQLMSSYPNTYDFMLHLTKEDGQNKKLYNRGYIKKLIREEDADKLKQRVEEKKKRKIPSTPSSNQTAPQSNTKKAKPPQMAAPPPLPTNITTSPSMSTSDSTLTKPIDQHDDDDEGEFFM